ncbi:transporter substrate-binding domain-containing protein [Kushneria phosphatilytica]|uniref:Transporter substrate-binding domain-containing protein n=1 Tax=Kushneria phosphatilytica TaxID=657387 RepID=A0A1S1NMQ0_9GAMM|nr:transporter substrate-binding domain-containing protein [Kushneria phosphatilytica]OHV08435.1 nickel transporter [Kushneria phosphatilytica]QEL09863.1 transporter substrate-binding domain-containing protein [Kushneria phosphatilytica]
MKRLLTATLITAMMLPTVALARIPDTVRLAIDVPYKPFVERAPDGQLKGFEIDLGNALCEHAELNCKWVEQSWDGIIPGLLARKYDAILSSMAITPERERQVLFSIPYYNTPSVWIAPRDSDIDISDKASLKGLSVGVQRGSIRDVYVTQEYGDVLDIRRYSSSEDVDNDLKTGRIDLAFEDFPLAIANFDFRGDDAPFKQVGPSIKTPTSIFGRGAAMAFRPRDKDLAAKFNQAIRDVYADGTFDKLMHQYFDYDLSTPPQAKQ